MIVCETLPWRVWPTFILLWSWMCDGGYGKQYQAEEEEIFHSEKQTTLGWKSHPAKHWHEIHMKVDTDSPVPVLQSCGEPRMRSILSQRMERKEAHYLLMDVAFTQEEESGELSQLQVHLFDSDTPITRFQTGHAVLDLQTSNPFPTLTNPAQTFSYLNRSVALRLGSVSRSGFHVAFSYSGPCVLITSVRLYYEKCPDITAHLASFKATAAGSGPQTGTCEPGAAVVSPPERECDADGVWSPLLWGCTCKAGHESTEDTCQACKMGYYKPANETGGCRLCPQNSGTHEEGSELCQCLPGFTRLPADPDDLGCTKPPSAPVNLTAHLHNDSVLIVTWDPPHDRGGRQEVMYHIKCEKQAEAASRWRPCGEGVLILPDSVRLTNTTVSIMGLNPQHDYRLSVHASNDLSTRMGAPPSSTATVAVHRWKVPLPAMTTATPGQISKHDTTQAPQLSRHFYAWLVTGVLFGCLLLVVVIPMTVCIRRRHYMKLRSDQLVELLPMDPDISYRRPQAVEAAPQQTNAVEGVAQMLEGFSGRLLASLKDVVVERNKLTLGKELGKGEFGSVYEGVFTPDEGVDMKVAVKTMRVGIHSQEDLHDFLKEAEIMQHFDHENVVKLLGVTLQHDQDSPVPVPLVILPYMKHRDLRRFLIGTRYGDIPMFVPHQSLLRFMIDIAAGMDYLSSQGFLHRDLAARNCMLGDDLRVCVADFGLSKKIYSNNYYRQKVAIRVPIKWMAMESLSESVYTTKSDVWSFGITMWEIVSRGRLPYPGVHNHELLDLLQSGHRLKPPEDCDHKLYEVMQSCWEKEPSHRPSFMDLGNTLKDLLSELPVLEASQEANYINQVLEVAAASNDSQYPHSHSERKGENVYLPNPVGAAAATNEDVEDGYLKYFTGSALKMDDE
ncbi:uncharacterized protein V6R79_023647 [Siganus canaliculatus]